MDDTARDPMLQFFAYEHLPQPLQDTSKPFGELALRMVETLPRNPERTAGLRKLLEAKDCAVRASLFKQSLAEALAPLVAQTRLGPTRR